MHLDAFYSHQLPKTKNWVLTNDRKTLNFSVHFRYYNNANRNNVCDTCRSMMKAGVWHQDYLCTDILQIRLLQYYQDVGPVLVQNHCRSLKYTANADCKLFVHCS